MTEDGTSGKKSLFFTNIAEKVHMSKFEDLV